MARLKAALIREYEDNEQVHIEVHNPRNTEAVTLNFRGEKLAKVKSSFRTAGFERFWPCWTHTSPLVSSQVMGSLADNRCVQGQRVSGILVKKNFNYHILNPSDLSSESSFGVRTLWSGKRESCRACFTAYTELAMSTVKQSQAIPFTGPYSLLVCHLRNLTGRASSLSLEDLHPSHPSSFSFFFCLRRRGGVGWNGEEHLEGL